MGNIPTPEEEYLMQQAKEEADKRYLFQQKVLEHFPQFGDAPAANSFQGGFLESLLRNANGYFHTASDFLDDLLRKDNERWEGPKGPFPRNTDNTL